jgi:L-fucose mutarotase/ribose pyranase (RbsD/FucU family)
MGMGTDWRRCLEERLPVFGHRNWIVVADAAYPAQSSPGIESVVASDGPLEVLQEVLALIGTSGHVKPLVLIDHELQFVAENDAPGVSAYRSLLAEIARPHSVQAIPHEEIISRLDQAGRAFRILIIKTPLKIPYTSVFLQLDCAYWNSEAEGRLRAECALHPPSAAGSST